MALNTASASKAACQPSVWVSQPPSGAHKKAIRPRPLSACDMACAPRSGSYRSRTTARAAITPAHMAAPCTARPAIKSVMLGAHAQTTAATV